MPVCLPLTGITGCCHHTWLLFKIYLLYMYVWGPACLFVHNGGEAGTCGFQKRASEPLELASQMAVSFHLSAKNWTQVPARAGSGLYGRVSSSAFLCSGSLHSSHSAHTQFTDTAAFPTVSASMSPDSTCHTQPQFLKVYACPGHTYCSA